MHRVRHALVYLAQSGWSASVLCVDSTITDAPIDPLLLETIPSQTEIVRAPCFLNSIIRTAGLGSLSVRAWRGLDAAGRRLLERGDFSLAYFSTTAFGIFPLARA